MEIGKKGQKKVDIYSCQVRRSVPRRRLCCLLPQLPILQPRPSEFHNKKTTKTKKQQLPQLSLLQPRPCGWVDSFYIKQFLMVTILFMANNQMNLKGVPSWLWLWNMNSVNLGGSSWLRQHCRLPRRSQCCCLPRISLLLNNKVLKCQS